LKLVIAVNFGFAPSAQHLVGITAHKKGLTLLILRCADELRKPDAYFEKLDRDESGCGEACCRPDRDMHAKVQAKVKKAVRRRMGKAAPKQEKSAPSRHSAEPALINCLIHLLAWAPLCSTNTSKPKERGADQHNDRHDPYRFHATKREIRSC
jgi:hypothetical protein